ncbi:MAG: hypothetical protein Q8O33_02565 [Pseudomonadota bacterium]|nr:hypothetical protein [Pseudomonadota bacterium]
MKKVITRYIHHHYLAPNREPHKSGNPGGYAERGGFIGKRRAEKTGGAGAFRPHGEFVLPGSVRRAHDLARFFVFQAILPRRTSIVRTAHATEKRSFGR